MRKTIALLMSLLLVASFTVFALAAESITITLAADKTSVYRGETVTFTISVPEVNCVSGGFLLEGLYDENVFEFVGGNGHLQACDKDLWESGNNIGGFSNVGYIADKLSGSFTYKAETKTSGVIFTINMKVKDTAAFGTTVVAPTVALRDATGSIAATINSVNITVFCDHEWSGWTKANDSEHSRQCSICQKTETEAHSFTERIADDAHLVPGTEETYYFDCAHCDAIGTETFDGAYIIGDVNNNSAVDQQDAIYLLRHVLFFGITGQYPVEQPVDYNHDDIVDQQDAIYLLRHVLFFNITGQYPLT